MVGIIVITVFLLIVAISGLILSDLEDTGLLAVSVVLFLIGLAFMFIVFHNSGYKKGQIDAINGEIIYELQTQPDSSVKWVEIIKE